jgi:alpha-tubulin suppressor-like RCC1 family protein
MIKSPVRPLRGLSARRRALLAWRALLCCTVAACASTKDVSEPVTTPPVGATPVPVTSVVLTPPSATLPQGATQQITAQTRDANGAVLAGRIVTWSTSDTAVATVSAAGLVTARDTGSATIAATSEGARAQAKVTVTLGVIRAVVVTPAAPTMIVGDSLVMTATPADSAGHLLTARTDSVTWQSSDTTKLTISSRGVARARAAGSATITATIAGQRGTTAVTIKASLIAVRNTLTAGLFHTCALSVSGDTYCWGHNGSDASWGRGQVGDGTATDRPLPARVAGTTKFNVLEASSFYSCGITGAGAAHCWGFNGSGQLGDGSFTTRLAPSPVNGALTFASVTGGYNHACALTLAGAAYCWGDGVQVPVKLAGSAVYAAISTRGEHTCALTTAGAAYCWGENGFGQLGNGSQFPQTEPVAVRNELVFGAISAGYLHTCALTTAGAAYCWGSNSLGQLGVGSAEVSSVPRAVGGSLRFTMLTSGYFHACGLTSTGDAYCWGYNASGAIGDGTTTNRATPTLVSGGQKFIALSAGGYHTCGLTSGGAAYCWGRNTYGAIGDGTVTNRLTPVAVGGGLLVRVP